MFGSTDPHRFRKTVAGWCMIAAPVLFLVGSVISPSLNSDEAKLVASAADHADRWYASNAIIMVAFALFMVATLGVMHMLRERGAAFGHIGGAVALIGILGAVAGSAVTLVMWQMAGGDRTEMVALLDRVFNTAGTALPLLFLSLGVTIGYLVLAWGLTVAKAAPLWMTGAIALAAVLYAVGGALFSKPLYLASSAVLLIGMGAMGRMVLEETVEEWEHTPEFHGARPLGTH
jgi:hypothetical protein